MALLYHLELLHRLLLLILTVNLYLTNLIFLFHPGDVVPE
jgi:hypothetical protein